MHTYKNYFCFVLVGPNPAVLRDYSWLCDQAGSGAIWDAGIEPGYILGLLSVRQMPYPLSYHSGPYVKLYKLHGLQYSSLHSCFRK